MRLILAFAIMVLGATAPRAEMPAKLLLSAPEGRMLLEIVITDPAPGAGAARTVRLDEAMLRFLPSEAFSTSTIWTEGVQHFRGVRLRTLMDCLGIRDGVLTLTAKNEYLVEIPMAELRGDGALVAYERNGRPMETRDKGPLWLVYPYDADPAFRTETIYAQSIWQLDRIEVTP